jgi:hypothetical protein
MSATTADIGTMTSSINTQDIPWIGTEMASTACQGRTEIAEAAHRDASTIARAGHDDLAWLRAALAGLKRMAALPPNWDDEGAPATEPQIVRAALELLVRIHRAWFEPLPKPDLCAIPGGGFQFEWEVGNRSLEIEFIAGDRIAFLACEDDPRGSSFTYGEYPAALLMKTVDHLRWLRHGRSRGL